MKLNEKLIELRKQNNLSQEELSYKLNISRQAISRWENGKTQPDIENIEKICKIYDITPDNLLGYSEQKKNHSTKTLIIIFLVIILGITTGFLIGLIHNEPSFKDYHHFYVDDLKMTTIEETKEYKKYNLSYMPSIINESFVYIIVVIDEKGNDEVFEAKIRNNICYSIVSLKKDKDVTIYAQIRAGNLKYSSPLIKVLAMKEE